MPFVVWQRFQKVRLGIADDLDALAGEITGETGQHQAGAIDGRLANDPLQVRWRRPESSKLQRFAGMLGVEAFDRDLRSRCMDI